jgi:membrane protease YdiL (CAAX protease family)
MRRILDVGLVRKIALFVPFVPALAMPGPGTLIAAVVVALALAAFPDARRATFARGPWLRSLGIGALCGVAIALLMGLLVNGWLTGLFGKTSDLSAFNSIKGNIAGYIQLLVLGLLYGAVVEEIVFRGFVIGWGSQLLGHRAAPLLAILSAMVFGVTHLYQGWTGVCSTGIIGLGYGLTYLASGRNLLAAIFAHMTLNAIGTTELYVSN